MRHDEESSNNGHHAIGAKPRLSMRPAVGFTEMTKTETRRIGIALALTAVIFVAGFFFIAAVSLPMVECVGLSDVENIKQFTRFRVVPPEWVTPGNDGLHCSWMKAESTTRLVLVLTVWLLALVFINPDKWMKRRSNNTSDGIRQPAGGSPKPSM
jgi:hypothetical protein